MQANVLTKLQQMQPASLPNWGARVNRGFLVNRMESLDRLGELPDFVRSSAPAARKPSGGTSTSIDQRDHRHEIHELPSRLLRSASTESPGAVLSEEDVAAIMTAVTRGEAFNDLIDASDTETLDKACRAFRLERFAAGATVCTEGILATVFYVVASGEFESDSPWPWGYSRHTYRAGSCFGDEALLGGCEHEHTFTCVTAGKVWALDHLIFRRILAEKNTLAMQRKASQLQLSDMDDQGSHGARGTPPPDAFDMRHLTALGWLGDGAFGVVWRVRHKPSGEAYALKCMERSRLRRPQDADGVLRERQILGLLAQREHAHALIVRAAAFFRGHLDDREGLYMLLELMSGGDLKAKLERLRCLPPSCCAFYAACTSAALLHLHALDIVYRDLKPENLVIDHSGYLKLIDFGLSKVLSSSADGRTWTLCGTPHFMAPEIIRGRGYGTSADWWALGILTYEMLTGACPFEGETQVRAASHSSRRASLPLSLSLFLTTLPSPRLSPSPPLRPRYLSRSCRPLASSTTHPISSHPKASTLFRAS